ncbi:uncharacterized protein OCT59_018510 [Rhizophagus irregularis]|uniref:uncharacterized protein n=1 Tax=Rhizophagus irregularis TaxID=588596 RepID=UPI00332D15D9|nr:hypothetical protein OCT59_018510 [Rhizophagus irregularis]
MSLKRSIKSKSRSLNLRQRDDNSLNSTELIMNEGDSDKNYNNDDVEFNGPIEIPFEREENDFPDNIDGEPIEIFEQNENELPENIDEYESFENISDSDSENIFENSSLLNSSFDGEFGPLFFSFRNLSSASIFAWITKHMISTNAYEDLIKILNHPNFDIKDVPTNIRNFKETSRNQLPLLTIKKHTIPISDMKTQSTSQPTREAYPVSLIDTLTKILSNPSLVSKMYNGPGIEIENKSEFWHGELWQQSPLFGAHSIIINSVKYFTGEFVHIITSNRLNCMRITSIIFHNENVKLKLQRFLRFEELPDRFKTSERASNINTRWLLEDKPIIVDPRVLVNKTSVWLRDQQKPSYYSYEVDEILYRYENTWKIRNICYRIRHPSEYCSFPQNSKLKELEKGKIINIQGEDTLVVAGLGLVTADLPQENDLAGVMRHNAKKILSSNSLTEQKVLCSELGLKNQKPVLDDLMFDRLLQTPHDIYHAIAGKILRLMDCTFNMFSSTGNNDFIKTWKIFEMPIQWHKLPNPVTHRQSFMMSDRLRLAMILPHILRRFLKLKHLKQRSIDELQENLSVNSGLVINRLIQCWAIVAKCARFCFNLSFNDESYETLNSLLKQEIILLTKMFPQNFTHLPNLHINAHLQCHAKTFATLVNSAVGIKEMVHRTFKGAVPHTNGKMIERDLIKRYNTLQALRNIIDGTLDSRYNTLGNGYYQNNIFRSLLSSWYATSVTNYDTREIDEEEINSPVDFICEIRCRIKWKYYEISQNNFEPNMSIDGDIYNGLKMAYKDYFNFLEYIHNKKIVYFNYITYKVLNDNDESSIIRIRVGDIVEIEEENEGTSYAIVKAIFLHTYNNDKTYPFYFVNWFEKVKGRNGFDTLMTCQKYKICTEREKYLNIFPISLVTSMPKIHFVHQCVDNCLIESHDLSQPYLLNEFFYNAI